MAVFHHYDCAGLDEPIGQIADKVWAFCFTALSGPVPPGPSSKATRRSSKSRVRRLNADRDSRADTVMPSVRSCLDQNQVLLSG